MPDQRGARVVTGTRLYSAEELAEMVRQRDRHGLDRYLMSLDCDPAVREFYLRAKPGREGKKSDFTAANNLRLARAKLCYRQGRDAGLSVDQARAEMLREYPMDEETAVRLTNGDLTHINRICSEISDPEILKSRGKSAP